MNAPASEPHSPTADEAAAGWLARKRSGVMTLDEGRRFEVWLASDPEHRAAYDALEELWGQIEGARTDPSVLAMREDARRWLARPSRRTWMGAAAASLAVIAGVGVYRSGVIERLFPAPVEQAFRTGLGQTNTVTLADGTIITLDTDTVLRSRQTRHERRLELERGQAFFRVSKDPARPFVVSAGGKTVTATGTAFEVRLDPHRFQVMLVEGHVRVEAPLPSAGEGFSKYVQTAEMTAGSRLTAWEGQRWSVDRIDVAQATGWLYGQLIVVRRPLGEVAEELNRYSARKIVVADARTARETISGSFRVGDVDGFVKAVRDYRLARVRGESPQEVRLGRF